MSYIFISNVYGYECYICKRKWWKQWYRDGKEELGLFIIKCSHYILSGIALFESRLELPVNVYCRL